MLTLAGQAVTAIRDPTTQPGLPADTGLRIAPEDGGAAGRALSLCDGPRGGDRVIEESEVQVLVQPDAAAPWTARPWALRSARTARCRPCAGPRPELARFARITIVRGGHSTAPNARVIGS